MNQRRAAQPLMPLRLFADRARAGAYVARFLFNGVLVSFFFFMTQYLQGVLGFTPLEAGLAFLPLTAAAFASAAATSRLTRRLGNENLAIAGCAAMLVGTALMSRVSVTTGYALGIGLPMVVFGIGQGLGLSALTTGGTKGGPRLVARDKASGKEVASVDLPAAAIGTPMTYMMGGKQYIAVTVGGTPVPELIALALP